MKDFNGVHETNQSMEPRQTDLICLHVLFQVRSPTINFD